MTVEISFLETEAAGAIVRIIQMVILMNCWRLSVDKTQRGPVLGGFPHHNGFPSQILIEKIRKKSSVLQAEAGGK